MVIACQQRNAVAAGLWQVDLTKRCT